MKKSKFQMRNYVKNASFVIARIDSFTPCSIFWRKKIPTLPPADVTLTIIVLLLPEHTIPLISWFLGDLVDFGKSFFYTFLISYRDFHSYIGERKVTIINCLYLLFNMLFSNILKSKLAFGNELKLPSSLKKKSSILWLKNSHPLTMYAPILLCQMLL